MKVKKTLSLFMAALLFISILASCSKHSTTTTPAGVKITVWMGNPPDSMKQYLEEGFKKKYPKMEVEYSYLSGEDLKNKVRIAIESNSLPDVFTGNAGTLFQEIVDKGATLDLTPYIEKYNLKERSDPKYFENYTSNGKIYGMPAGGVTVWQNLYYNQDILNQNGITPPKTWAEFFAACKKLQEKNIQPLALGGKDQWPALLLMGDLMLQYSDFSLVEKINKGTTKWTEADAMKKALNILASFHSENALMKGANSTDQATAIQTFATGKTAFLYNGSWWPGLVDGGISALKFKPGVIWLPRDSADSKLNGVQMSADMPFIISSHSKNPDVAAQWVDFYTSSEFQKMNSEANNYFSIYPGVTETMKMDPLFKSEPILKQFDYTKTGVFFDWAFPANVTTVMKTQIQMILDGKASVDDALKAIQATQDEALKNKK